MISKWNYLPLTTEEQELEIALAKKFANSPAIAELLVQRGITTVDEAEKFSTLLYPTCTTRSSCRIWTRL